MGADRVRPFMGCYLILIWIRFQNHLDCLIMCQSISLCVVQVVGAHKCALRLSTGCYLIIRYRRFHNYLIVCMSMTLCVVQMAGDKHTMSALYRWRETRCALSWAVTFTSYTFVSIITLICVCPYYCMLHRWCYTGGVTQVVRPDTVRFDTRFDLISLYTYVSISSRLFWCPYSCAVYLVVTAEKVRSSAGFHDSYVSTFPEVPHCSDFRIIVCYAGGGSGQGASFHRSRHRHGETTCPHRRTVARRVRLDMSAYALDVIRLHMS